jgi:hypothetical protein
MSLVTVYARGRWNDIRLLSMAPCQHQLPRAPTVCNLAPTNLNLELVRGTWNQRLRTEEQVQKSQRSEIYCVDCTELLRVHDHCVRAECQGFNPEAPPTYGLLSHLLLRTESKPKRMFCQLRTNSGSVSSGAATVILTPPSITWLAFQ